MLRGGIIGAGHVALHGHVPGWSARAGVTLVAAADPRPDARAGFETLLPALRWHESAETLLASEALDFVDVCSPPSFHGAAIALALERGVHVLCEKPLVLEMEELSKLAALATRRGRVLAAVHNWRHAPVLAAATQLVRSGAIGHVLACRWEVLRDRPSVAGGVGLANWRLDPALSGGGILVDHGWHAVYVLGGWFSGRLSAVAGRLETRRHRQWPVEDTADVKLEFEGGEARVFLTWAADTRANRVEIEGTRGRIVVDGGTLALDAGSRSQDRAFSESLAEGSHHPTWFAGAAGEFLDAIASGRPAPSLPEAAICLEAIHLAQESSRRGGVRLETRMHSAAHAAGARAAGGGAP
jgi:predicted dehydrogenase